MISEENMAAAIAPDPGNVPIGEITALGREAEQELDGLLVPTRIERRYHVDLVRGDDDKSRYLGLYRIGDASPTLEIAPDRIRTRIDSPEVIRDMLAVARHRGWDELDARGTHEFRRQVWLEAAQLGVEVRGYEPGFEDRKAELRQTEMDRQQRVFEDRDSEREDKLRSPSPEERLAEIFRSGDLVEIAKLPALAPALRVQKLTEILIEDRAAPDTDPAALEQEKRRAREIYAGMIASGELPSLSPRREAELSRFEERGRLREELARLEAQRAAAREIARPQLELQNERDLAMDR